MISFISIVQCIIYDLTEVTVLYPSVILAKEVTGQPNYRYKDSINTYINYNLNITLFIQEFVATLSNEECRELICEAFASRGGLEMVKSIIQNMQDPEPNQGQDPQQSNFLIMVYMWPLSNDGATNRKCLLQTTAMCIYY